MLRFNCDYSETAHPRILQKMLEAEGQQYDNYGEDRHCALAAQLILAECGNPDADVHFLVGGTQANLTVITAALRPHQAVISADSGHINTHESGAIEATGHKVIAAQTKDGKILAEEVRRIFDEHHQDESKIHTVQPKMAYISHPTELGTLYSQAELTALSQTCREKRIILFMDGARLGYGLTAKGTDVSMADIARLCDVFYIGGTKVGALFGEAVVICHKGLREDFRYMIKQRGGLLAKGFLLGMQFEALFEDGLYYRLGKHANEAAMIIRKALEDAGHSFLCHSPTNQQFPILPNRMLNDLAPKFSWATICKIDEQHTAVRFCTSWATKMEDARALAQSVRNWKG